MYITRTSGLYTGKICINLFDNKLSFLSFLCHTHTVRTYHRKFPICVQAVGCVVSLFMISTKMTIGMIVTVPVLVGAGAVFGSILRRLSRKAQAQVSKATGVADEAIGNVRTVRAFAMEDQEME